MPDGTLPRRSVLTVAAAAGALTACSTAVPTGPPASGAATPAPRSDDGGSDDDGGSGGSGSGGSGTALGPASEVPVGSARIYADQKVVVTQAAAGSYAAFSTTCPHQGCAVSSVSGGTIVCPCHGSTFALDGSVVQGPATRGLTKENVTVSGGQLTLS